MKIIVALGAAAKAAMPDLSQDAAAPAPGQIATIFTAEPIMVTKYR